jgi:Na+-translocating ferredoxin:NAD+ oxidoreductase RnfD subunit
MPLLQPAAVGLLLVHIVFAFYMHPKTEAGDACWPVLARPLAAKQEATGAAGIVKEFFGGDIRQSVSRTEYEDVLFGKKDAPARTAGGQVAEAIHGPRPLDAAKAGDAEGVRQYQGIDVLLGSTPGPIGGASGVALVFGLLLIVFSGAVTWITPLAALGCMLALLTLTGDPHIGVHMLSPYTLIGFFYLAANPTTVPRSKRGKVLAGIAVAVLEVMLRKWTPLSEGTFLSAILVQSSSIFFDLYIAQPKEKHRPDDSAVEFSNLSRL